MNLKEALIIMLERLSTLFNRHITRGECLEIFANVHTSQNQFMKF